MALDSESARQLQKALDTIAGQVAGLAGIISQLPETQRLSRSQAKRQADRLLSSPDQRRFAEKIIDDLLPAFPKKDGQGQG